MNLLNRINCPDVGELVKAIFPVISKKVPEQLDKLVLKEVISHGLTILQSVVEVPALVKDISHGTLS